MGAPAQVRLSPAACSWLSAIFSERFHRPLSLDVADSGHVLRCVGAAGAICFDSLAQGLLQPGDADLPCPRWEGADDGWHLPMGSAIPAPGGFIAGRPLIEQSAGGYTFHYDLPGLAFWMMARLEEVGRTDLDAHDRFPATSSHAFRHGYLERPAVDEWLAVLGQVIARLWPRDVSGPKVPPIAVSHDVDSPSRYAFGGLLRLGRTIAGDVVHRRELSAIVSAPAIRWGSRSEIHPRDPANTFDWIMDQSERAGLTSAFYFICGRTDPARDAAYDPEDRRIRRLMEKIHARGHEIGLHPSYGTYNDPNALVAEAETLRRVCAEEGISQREWGGRMHFLRWQTPGTLHAWEAAGMTYDSTLSYADLPGFRCGTCFEYPAFDPVADTRLKLRLRPLVAMECTVMAPRYLGLGSGQAALDKFVSLKKACQAVGGTFTTLWHNTYLESRAHRDIYQKLLAA